MLDSCEYPPTLAELKANEAYRDYDVRDEVLSPILRFKRDKKTGLASCDLAACRSIRGRKIFYSAPSINHDYVLADKTVYPLPVNISIELHSFIGKQSTASFSLAELIRFEGFKGDEFSVEIDPELFLPGADVADQQGESYSPHPDLCADLYPYQLSGVAWLVAQLANSSGVILADEMGLGKTIQVIAAILDQGPTIEHPVLIVCPTSLISNWLREFQKFAPSLSVSVHRGADRAGVLQSLLVSEVILCTYDTVVNDRFLMESVRWKNVICDEAQALKNPEAERRIVIAGLNSEFKLLMTGTPVETSLLNAWSLSDLAIPGILGSQESFEAQFPDETSSAERLNGLLSPLILRRTVARVASDLPPRIDIQTPVALGDTLENAYEAIRQDSLEEYGRAGALVATTRLSVFCAHPQLVLEDDEEYSALGCDAPRASITPKMEVALSILDRASHAGTKVLLFSNYNNVGLIFQHHCSSMPIRYWNSINGSTPQELRQQIIDEFTACEGSAVLVLNPKAAGAGLNITAATVVIHYTPVWNPALEMQASARAHRRGQELPVTVYMLYYEETVEQIMVERALWRRGLGDRVIPDLDQNSLDHSKVLEISPITKEA